MTQRIRYLTDEVADLMIDNSFIDDIENISIPFHSILEIVELWSEHV